MLASDRNGMIYADHDFATNFFNAVGNNDTFSVQHQIIDEIAKLVVINKRDIVQLLRGAGINISIQDNNLKVGSYLASELKRGNANVKAGIVDLLKEKYSITNSSITGTTYEKILRADATKAASNVLDVMDSTKTLTQNITDTFEKENVGISNTGDLLAERIKLNEMVVSSGKKIPMPKWMKITLVATVSVVTVTIFAIIIKKLYKSNDVALPSATTLPPSSSEASTTPSN